MKQIFINDIFPESTVAAHAVKVPVTHNLSAEIQVVMVKMPRVRLNIWSHIPDTDIRARAISTLLKHFV